MADIGDLRVLLSLEADKFKSGLDDAMSGLQKTQTTIANGFNALGGAVVAGAGVAVAGLTAFIADSTVEASKAADIQAQLASVLKSTGGASGMTAESVNSLAESLSNCTKFEDDTIVGAENMLLTFTNIGKDVFPQATETVLDMSQALGQDLKSSSIQLGKALNDPINGITALSRVGVSFTEEQKKQIEGFMKVNDVASAQKIILGELAKEFGGSAKAAGETLTGKLEILKNKFGNIKETIGGALLPALTQLADTLSNKLNDPAVQAFIESFANSLANFAVTAISYLPQVIQGFKNIISFFQQNQGIFIGILVVLGVAVVSFCVTAIAGFVALIASIAPFIAVVAAIIAVVALVYTAWQNNWLGIQDLWNMFTAGFIPLWQAFIALLHGDWVTFGAKLKETWNVVLNNISTIFTGWWNLTRGNFQKGIDAIIGFFKSVDWAGIGRSIIEGIGNGISSMIGWLSDMARQAAEAAYNAAKNLLGIHSPSTVFADIGKNMMLGWGQGISDFASVPVNMTMGTSNLVMDSVGSSSGGGDTYFNITVNVTGNADKQTIASASKEGVLEALRRKGRA